MVTTAVINQIQKIAVISNRLTLILLIVMRISYNYYFWNLVLTVPGELREHGSH